MAQPKHSFQASFVLPPLPLVTGGGRGDALVATGGGLDVQDVLPKLVDSDDVGEVLGAGGGPGGRALLGPVPPSSQGGVLHPLLSFFLPDVEVFNSCNPEKIKF